MGLMQLMPGTAQELGVEQPYRPDQNLLGGATYLARLQARYGERLDLALAAYNAGPGRVEAAGHEVPPIAETRNYVQKVMALYDRLRGAGGTEMASP
jgi:soluble lytic murein transglycosylase-like protein